MGGIDVDCLVDTGSDITTLPQSFFNEKFSDIPWIETRNWLNITAANGIEIEYVGVAILDITFCGVTVPQRGVIITRDLNPEVVGRRATGILGTKCTVIHTRDETIP